MRKRKTSERLGENIAEQLIGRSNIFLYVGHGQECQRMPRHLVGVFGSEARLGKLLSLPVPTMGCVLAYGALVVMTSSKPVDVGAEAIRCASRWLLRLRRVSKM